VDDDNNGVLWGEDSGHKGVVDVLVGKDVVALRVVIDAIFGVDVLL
jgi:hypothetical protein